MEAWRQGARSNGGCAAGAVPRHPERFGEARTIVGEFPMLSATDMIASEIVWELRRKGWAGRDCAAGYDWRSGGGIRSGGCGVRRREPGRSGRA